MQCPALRSFFRNERGGALAEIAILVPILVVMLAAVAEFGRYFQTYTTLSKATRSAARYLSSRPLTDAEKANAKNLVVCGNLVCNPDGGDELVKGITTAHVCIETTNPPDPTVKVSIPKVAEEVGPGEEACGAPYMYEPIFNIGALLHNSFSLDLPISTSTTMYQMVLEGT